MGFAGRRLDRFIALWVPGLLRAVPTPVHIALGARLSSGDRTRKFTRTALGPKTGLTSSSLCTAVPEMAAGRHDADLSGGLLKIRIARSGQGKSGGFRTLVATNKGGRWVFVFVFSKNERSNIDKDEEQALKTLAWHT